jgi:hypothetical protein
MSMDEASIMSVSDPSPRGFLARALSVINREPTELLAPNANDFYDYYPREGFLSLEGASCRVALDDFFLDERLDVFQRIPITERNAFGGTREALWFVKGDTALEVLLAIDEADVFSRADLTLFVGRAPAQTMSWIDRQIAEVAASEVSFLANRLAEIAKVVGKESVRSILPAAAAEVLA